MVSDQEVGAGLVVVSVLDLEVVVVDVVLLLLLLEVVVVVVVFPLVSLVLDFMARCFLRYFARRFLNQTCNKVEAIVKYIFSFGRSTFYLLFNLKKNWLLLLLFVLFAVVGFLFVFVFVLLFCLFFLLSFM